MEKKKGRKRAEWTSHEKKRKKGMYVRKEKEHYIHVCKRLRFLVRIMERRRGTLGVLRIVEGGEGGVFRPVPGDGVLLMLLLRVRVVREAQVVMVLLLLARGGWGGH